MPDHILLVEPDYYSQFPPIGLLKISAFEKSQGNTTELVRKLGMPVKTPDKIYVTSLFTWAWRQVWHAIRQYKSLFPDTELWLGGLYASLLPDHARLSGVNNIYEGLHLEADDMMPDYSLVPEWEGSIVWSSRGCDNVCLYCAVPKLEGKLGGYKKSIKKFVYPGHTKLIFFDNNILSTYHWKEIFHEVIELNMETDFNQGLDARFLTDDCASLLSEMRLTLVRLAYDDPADRDYIKSAIELLGKYGISKRKILVYALFNYRETPNEFFERVKNIVEWGASCYPMRFQPCNTLEKDSYEAPQWTSEQLDLIAKARRVWGYGGAFPPHEGIIDKFSKSTNFDEAFSVWEKE